MVIMISSYLSERPMASYTQFDLYVIKDWHDITDSDMKSLVMNFLVSNIVSLIGWLIILIGLIALLIEKRKPV